MALFGGNSEGMDKDAALVAFLATFKTEDQKLKDRLTILFLQGFLRSYRKTRDAILELAKKAGTIDYRGELVKGIYVELFQEKFIQLNFTGSQQIERARKLGEMLGTFLAFIEYGVSSTDPEIQRDIDRYYNFTEEIKELPLILKESGASIKRRFIANRVKQIARKKAGKLTKQQQKVLAEIAAMFW